MNYRTYRVEGKPISQAAGARLRPMRLKEKLVIPTHRQFLQILVIPTRERSDRRNLLSPSTKNAA
jgi:hypothetical protein